MLAKKDMTSRDHERFQTGALGTCKTDHGQEWEISFCDISRGGCRVDDSHQRMSLGAHVILTIAGTGPHRAEVAWRQGDRVGLEFSRLLPAPLFQHLAAEEWDLAKSVPVSDTPQYPVRRVL